METIKASVIVREEKRFISIDLGAKGIAIPISEDKPIEIKNSFNKLIFHLKNGEFEIQLDDVGNDLYSLVAKEYVIQLNREIHGIFCEMEEFGLLIG